MATGVSSYMDVVSVSFVLRVEYSEEYDITSNSSTLTITNVSLSSSSYSGYTYYPHGYIKVNGTEVANFSSSLGTHNFYISAKNTFYSINAASGYSAPPYTSGSIAHNDDGSKSVTIEVYINLWRMSSGAGSGTNLSGSHTAVLTTIPRKSTLSVASGTLGTAQTLTVTQKASSFTHTITATCGSASTTVCTKSSSTSISFTPPLSWASQNTTGTSVSVKYTITTYNGSTSIGSNSYTVSCTIPSSVKPSVSITVSDAMGYASTYGGYLKGLSKFKIELTPTTSYGSAISSYKITANGSTYTTQSATTDVIKTSGTLTISASVTDARNRSGSASTTATVLDYTAPTVSLLKVIRCDSDGTENDQGEYVQVTYSGTVASLSSKNTAKWVLYYKKTSESSYTSVTLSTGTTYTMSSATYILAADSGSSYNIKLEVTDNFTTGSKETVVSTAFTMMHFNAAGNGMAIGKVSEYDNVFDVGLSSIFRDDVYGMAGGLGYVEDIPSGSDVNNYLTPGWYAVPSNTIAANISNMPTSEAGKLKVSTGTGQTSASVHTNNYAYVLQTYYLYTGKAVYIRYCVANGTAGSFAYSNWYNVLIDTGGSVATLYGIKGGSKTHMYTSSEGGNIAITSPNGVYWEMDAYNDGFRLYCTNNGTNYFPFAITSTGQIYFNQSTLADFVVAQGTSGIWTYRKWNSGIAECWCKTSVNTVAVTSTWGNIYSCDMAVPSISLPFSFTDIPKFIATPWKNNANWWLYTNNVQGGTTVTPAYGVARGTSSDSVNAQVDLYVIGTWK